MDPQRAPAPGLSVGDLSRVGRDGHLRLRFERRGARTVLARSGFTLPLQVMAPVALDDPAAVVSVLNPTGGLLGGDRLVIDVEVGADAHACLTTPSATKVYRARDAAAVQDVRARVGPGAAFEWVPEHTIPFAGSALRQSIDVEIAETGRMILADTFSAGRVARGEAWRFAHLESALRVRDARGWVLLDRFVLVGDAGWCALGATEGAPYFGTVVIVGEVDVGALASDLTARLGAHAVVGALPRRGALVRCLAPDASALGYIVDAVWDAARQALLGYPAPRLRKN